MQGIPFRLPYIANQFFPDPGRQVLNPGQSVSPAKAAMTPYTVKPWPRMVQSINSLGSNSGTPRARAPVAVVNNYAPNPSNFLVIGGFVGKSQG